MNGKGARAVINIGGVRIPNGDDVQQWKKIDLTFYILRLVLHVIKVEFE